MEGSANVMSIEAITALKVALVQFCDQAALGLDSIQMNVRRTIEWIGHEQRQNWERELRKRHNQVAIARSELARKQLRKVDGRPPDCSHEKEELALAKRRVDEAETKIANCKRWATLLEKSSDEHLSHARRLAEIVEGDPPACIADINKILDALAAYLEVPLPLNRNA